MDDNILNWPVSIKHGNDMELAYVNNHSEWDSDSDLHLHQYEGGLRSESCAGYLNHQQPIL